jgi:hypothetical protein
VSIPLAALEEITDTSGIAPRIELLLPTGVRRRQLRVRTLLAGMLLSQAGQRPAHLTRVRDALTALPGPGQARPGVLEDWKTGPHQLTCRQTERTFGLVTDALAKDVPDGRPAATLATICDDLLEASIPVSSRTPARRWRWTGPTWKPSPGRRPAAAATAPTPKPPGDIAPAAAPARTASCSSAATPRPAP